LHEAGPLAIIWLLAVLSAASRAVRDDDYRHTRNLVASCCTGGFIALGIVTILDYSLGGTRVDYNFGRGLYIGIAALAGALRKEQEAKKPGITSGFISASSIRSGGLRKPISA